MTTTPDKPRLPDLEFRCPDCPFCGDEVNSEDGDFYCEKCNVAWTDKGENGERTSTDLPQCSAERSPWENEEKYLTLRPLRYRCVLDEGHKPPHRGYRIDDTDNMIDAHVWKDTAAVSA